MDPNTRALIMGAAGAGGAAAATYVEDVFSTWLYTGNGSTQTITNGIDLAGKGGLVWIKSRATAGYSHSLFDTARGISKAIYTDVSNAQATYSGFGVTAFNAAGFSLADNDGGAYLVNGTGDSLASWTFRKAAKFFDVVTYTGDGSSPQTINHNLGSTPGVIIIKATSTTSDWITYHRSVTNGYLLLNTTGATYTRTDYIYQNPTSTTFQVGFAANTNGVTYVAYLFAHDAGGFGDSGNESVVKCGSFTTDGSANATVNLGWEPQWILFKRTDSSTSGEWYMLDTMRGWCTGTSSGSNDDRHLWANSANAESTPNGYGDVLPTGFLATGVAANATFIYIAIRRGPMKTPTDATKVFSATTRTGIGTFTTGFPVDFNLGIRNDGAVNQTASRLTGNNASLSTNSTAAEQYLGGAWAFDSNTQFKNDGVGANSIHWTFRRAPGFFDVVAYTGTGANRTVSHNLGVAPELIIVKRRDAIANWIVFHASLGTDFSGILNQNGAISSGTGNWNATSPTSSVFSLGTGSNVNASASTYVAYLFATCPGVSKVGSYTGTGTTLSVDCGFTNGARFVLIKRTDSTGDWYVWDTARGIVSGNDPSLLLNSAAAEVTNTDYIDPLNSGFEISSTAPAAINANGGSFIFLAVA